MERRIAIRIGTYWARTLHSGSGEEMKPLVIAVLSVAAIVSATSAEAQAVDSRGFDASGICRRPEGCVIEQGRGGYNGPRNYRNFNGRNERDGRNDRGRDDRRYRSQNRTSIESVGIIIG